MPDTKAHECIVITGGAGFIGSAACRYFLKRGRRVICLDKLTYAATKETIAAELQDPNFTFVQKDIRDENCLDEVFGQYPVDAVINFAAESHVDRSISSPAEFLLTNVMGTYSMLQQARRYHDQLSAAARDWFRFLHVSTDEVFGDLPHDAPAFREDTPYQPSSPYSASKASSDHLVAAWQRTYNLPTLLTNCSNNYGPYQFPEKLIPVVIFKCLNNQPIPIYGRGDQIRDWLFVEDHVDAIATVLDRADPGSSYNIGTRNERKNIDLVRQICSILDQLRPRADGQKHDSAITHVSDRLGHDVRYAVDPSRLEQDFGWRSRHSFEQAIDKTVRWYLDNEHWWRPLLSRQ